MSVEAILEEIRELSAEERQRLISLIEKMPTAPAARQKPRRSILELEGLGAEIWQGIDAQEYVRQLRDEGDEA